MRRHELLDTIGLSTVFLLSGAEALTHFGYHRDHGFCLSIPLMICSALLLLAVHWPRNRMVQRPRADIGSPRGGAGLSLAGPIETATRD